MIVADKKYMKLIQKLPLKTIENDQHLQAASTVVDELVDALRQHLLSHDEQSYLDVLTKLIVDYESEHFALKPLSIIDRVKYLIDENGLSQTDLVPIFGSHSRVSEFLNGKRELSKAQILNLAKRFKLSPALFLTTN